MLYVFFYRFNYKNPQHNSHSETTHILYVYTQQYLSSRKTSICNHFPLPQGILWIDPNESAFAFYVLTNTFCWCIYIKGEKKCSSVFEDVHSLQVERVKVGKWIFFLFFLYFSFILIPFVIESECCQDVKEVSRLSPFSVRKLTKGIKLTVA